MASMMRQPFEADGVDYVAVGRQRDNLRVWRIDGEFLQETRLRFPACTRFMQDVDLATGDSAEWETITRGFTVVRLRPEAATT